MTDKYKVGIKKKHFYTIVQLVCICLLAQGSVAQMAKVICLN